MRAILSLAFILAAAVPALAGATDWVELGPDTRARLISTDHLLDGGSTLVALEIDMPMATKTYWRVPGETGIPTQFDLSGSTGVRASTVVWPYPAIDQTAGYTDFTYHGPTVIPIELAVEGDAPVADVHVTLGICAEVCVPADAHLRLPLSFERRDAGQGARIAQAIAASPLPWPGPDTALGEPVIDVSDERLDVPLDMSGIDPMSLIAAGESGHLFGAPQKSPQPGIVSFPLLGGAEGSDLVGKPVRLIFMTRDGPFEVERTVRASTPAAS